MAFWLLSTANAIVAAVLLYAGMYKIAQPEQARRALSETGGRRLHGIGADTVRAIAAVEAVAGAALTVPATRVAAAPVVIGLGIAFATAGIAGVRRRGVEHCGCLGTLSSAPLGPRNVLLGAAVAASGAANLGAAVAAAGAGDLGAPAGAVPTATASLLLATCLFAHRAAARRLLWSHGTGT